MPIDLQLFREDQGGDPKLIEESQRKRFKDPKVVQQVIELDQQCRAAIGRLDEINKEARICSKSVGEIMKGAKKDKRKPTEEELARVNELKQKKLAYDGEQDNLKKSVAELTHQRDALINTIGNIVADSCVIAKEEKDNELVRRWGRIPEKTGRERHHHELLWMIGGYEPERGAAVAGHRGYFLTGPGVLLNMALQQYGVHFLLKRGYNPVYPPFFMNKEVMARTAQLEDFDEQLYHVQGESDDTAKYLIATSEQPISAMHHNEWLKPDQLPIRYAGVSTNFRKEAGAHGRDAWGIYRVHQFDKIEQFMYCAPEESWKYHEEMIGVSEEFYQSLGIPYEVVNIVSGDLNNAAAKKYDLEGWFPTLGIYRELVSCSNCTDYQSRGMNTRFGFPKTGDRQKAFVHMLNSTLCATTRTICCILENYQTDDGVHVPEVLQPYCAGQKFFKFVRPPPDNKQQKKKDNKKKPKPPKQQQQKPQPAEKK